MAQQPDQLVKRGMERMRDPSLNFSLGYTFAQRNAFGLRGLIPPAIMTLDQHVQCVITHLRAQKDDLEKYKTLFRLRGTNLNLYFAVLIKHTAEVMPYVYTPTVGAACINFSLIYDHTCSGLYLPITLKGSLRQVLDNWCSDEVECVVVTDGERILGLGDLGIDGMGIPIGKLALYTACAGINPKRCLPITLDMGTNNKKKLEDPVYMGLKQERVPAGPQVDEFVTEVFEALQDKFGRNLLIQFEDFGNGNAFRLLETFKDKATCFNDDIQGTASVVLAGLIASEKITGLKLSQHTFLFNGAGEAGCGIAQLIADAIVEETGCSMEQARSKIWMVDSRGLIVKGRSSGGIQHHKEPFAHEHAEVGSLLEAAKAIKPTALIGVSAQPKSFSQELLESVSQNTERPIVFALSNPTSKAECTPEEAYTYTKCKAIYASGSPFQPLTIDGQQFVPGQGNNSYIFPGVGLGVVACGATKITNTDMVLAARTLASLVTEDRFKVGCLYPPLDQIREVSAKIGQAVAEANWARGTATVEKPADTLAFVKSKMWAPSYSVDASL
eukprot:m.259480 g.259480  ORF g.259480 m.259480 type:complete len:556 (+) comp15554_c2_seq2:257-1924(+)